ncbi:MAG: SIR2 family protein [Cucumibacter sp.]
MSQYTMPHFLLTGAGFSRNRGGWLASEVVEYLLGCREISDDLRQSLWEDRARGLGFEDTLSRLQQQAVLGSDRGKKQLVALQTCISDMFDVINGGLRATPFEASNLRKFSVAAFLTRFDAIFTVNQDWLLETHYLNENVSLLSDGRWTGFQIPGVSIHRSGFGSPPISVSVPTDWRSEPSVSAGQQSFLKLQGSSNWHYDREDAAELLIMGGHKLDNIRQHPILNWYFEKSAEYLLRPSTRLMVIGYGFGDSHINAAIVEAVARGGLRLFLVDPAGANVVDKRDPRAQLQPRNELELSLRPGIIGASRRSIRTTFGGDEVEFAKLMRFFEP